jgi:hypothetical protein
MTQKIIGGSILDTCVHHHNFSHKGYIVLVNLFVYDTNIFIYRVWSKYNV